MKPPPRKRVKRSLELRAVPELPGRSACKWPPREQTRLLTALTRLCPGRGAGGPGAGGPGAELSGEPLPDPERVQEYLPSRTPAEINSVLDTLKEKVVLFAKTKQRAERKAERRDRRPLELWIHKASAVSGGAAEESLSTAFSQLLTVASTEPCALKAPVLHNTTALSEAQSPADGSLPSSTCEVSFEKIYHYLSVLHKPSEQCKLTPMESAVVLDLLMALPEQLLVLDCDPLIQHVTQTYELLSSGTDSRRTNDKTIKHQPPSAPPDLQQPPSALPDLQQPPSAPPDLQQPTSAPPDLQQPPTAPPDLQQPPSAPPDLQQPPTAPPDLQQPPSVPSDLQQPPTAPPMDPQPPQGYSSTQTITTVMQNSVLNPFLIPVSLIMHKVQADQT